MTNKTNTDGKQNMQHLLLYPNMVLENKKTRKQENKTRNKQINFTKFD